MTDVVFLLCKIAWQVGRLAVALLKLIRYLPEICRHYKADRQAQRERVDRILNPQKYLGAE